MADLLSTLGRHRLGLFVALIGLAVVALVWSARGALPAFVIGAALALVLDPLVTLLARRGLPRWAGVLVSYVLVVVVVWALLAFALPPVARQARELIGQTPQLLASVQDFQRAIDEWYASLPLPPDLRAAVDAAVLRAEAAFAELLRSLFAPAIGTLLRTVGFVVGLIVVPVWLFYVLRDRERIAPALAGLLPENWREDAGNVLGLLAGVGGRWVRGQLVLGVAIFVATVIGLLILTAIGFREFGAFTLVLALIAGVLEWFPIIGPVVAAIPAILIGLSISPAAALAAIVLYVVIQQLENNLLVPKVLGDAVDLHPALLIVALVVGGALFGLGGAILAAPVTAAGRDLYRYTFARLDGRPPADALLAASAPRPERAPAATPAEAEPA